MTEVSDRVHQFRDEVADGIAQLAAAAADASSVVGEESRRAQERLRRRAINAARALRGAPVPSRRRWLALGVLLGFVAGVGIANALRQGRRHAGDEHDVDAGESGSSLADAAREKRQAATRAVREKAEPARDALRKVTDRLTADKPTDDESSPEH